MNSSVHQSVLLKEVLEGLSIKEGDVVVDATLGGGGVSESICKDFGKKVRLLGIDSDKRQAQMAKERVEKAGCKIEVSVENFRNIDLVLKEAKLKEVDKIIFDLGISSDQYQSGRGFSLKSKDPLSMTFEENPAKNRFTALDIINTWNAESISDVIKAYGEERYSKRIARAIVSAREKGEIKTADQLTEIITSAVPSFYRKQKIHPATRTFQALRIAVNDELEALREGLGKALVILSKGGRIAVISFHSLEDRIVKRAFREVKDSGNFKIINKKPIYPSQEEIERNPRSRSAKLRIIERTN